MTIQEMIEVLEAAKRGEVIEYCRNDLWFHMEPDMQFNFYYEHRIAPKKMTLVEKLRYAEQRAPNYGELMLEAADRIEELESSGLLVSLQEMIAELEQHTPPIRGCTTDELLTEIARRIGK